jgi:hypothetical protein
MQLHQLKRREFITLIGGGAVAWLLAARAQQAGKVPTVGLPGAAAVTAWSPFAANFVRRLGELGWVEDRRVTLGRRVCRCAEAEISARFIARHKFGHGRKVRQRMRALAAHTASARSLPALMYSMEAGIVSKPTCEKIE